MIDRSFSSKCGLLPLVYQLTLATGNAQLEKNTRVVNVDSGWAANSVNAVIFRKNSLTSNKDWQYIAFYNSESKVVLGKRKAGAVKWQLHTSLFDGNTADAHNAISIMVDGDGYLHLAWDHHNNKLNYARSIQPGSLEMTARLSMTGALEEKVTYPEFYSLASGDLLFLYRDGGSGKGNVVINYYNKLTRKWKQLHKNLIDGQGERNAYWQACTDEKGRIHLSWVWRESPDVASNHDLCYARSDDKGLSWVKSTGEQYQLPITAANAEYAAMIPEKSELINRTSMYATASGQPVIATYWRSQPDSIPQYHIVYNMTGNWTSQNLQFRTTVFSLNGAGTKAIPISRPQTLSWKKGRAQQLVLIFRDVERGNKVSLARNDDLQSGKWRLSDLTGEDLGSWEPSYDTELWKREKILHLFVQKVKQVDAEGRSALPAQMIKVVEWSPK